MDDTDDAVTRETLAARLGTAEAPVVIDVRRQPRFEESDIVIPGTIRRAHDQVAAWQGSLPRDRDVVVYCVHGLEIGRDAAAELREAGFNARFLIGGIEDWRDNGGAVVAKHEHLTAAKPSEWVTRERPKIDRVACPWLISRFIDPAARFHYVPTEQVFSYATETGAIPYDIPGAEPFSHDGDLCSFDTFIRHYAIRDPALDQLALIVRGADTACLDLTPQSAGLLAIFLGMSANFGTDDHAMLEAGMVIYDALYTWCRTLRAETHNWTPAAAA